MPEHTDNSEAMRLADYARGDEYQRAAEDAVDLIRQQAERIAELEAERDNLHTTMLAAAVAIQAHWDAHCDAEGYGPSHLMHRLERGIASRYDYDAATLQRVETERDQLRAEVERLNPNAERWEWTADGNNFDEVFALLTDPKLTTYELTRAVDAARTTHKETE